jgi:hypothetical protein
MLKVLENENFSSAQDFVIALNSQRLKNPKKWITYVGTVNGKSVEIKTYDCSYLQIFRVDGVNDFPVMDVKPTVWKDFILKRLI